MRQYEPEGTTEVADVIVGKRREEEAVYGMDYKYKNEENYNLYLELHMPLPKGKVSAYYINISILLYIYFTLQSRICNRSKYYTNVFSFTDKKIHYLSGRNYVGSSIVMCGSYLDNIDKSEGVVTLRFPPNSECNIRFTLRAH